MPFFGNILLIQSCITAVMCKKYQTGYFFDIVKKRQIEGNNGEMGEKS